MKIAAKICLLPNFFGKISFLKLLIFVFAFFILLLWPGKVLAASSQLWGRVINPDGTTNNSQATIVWLAPPPDSGAQALVWRTNGIGGYRNTADGEPRGGSWFELSHSFHSIINLQLRAPIFFYYPEQEGYVCDYAEWWTSSDIHPVGENHHIVDGRPDGTCVIEHAHRKHGSKVYFYIKKATPNCQNISGPDVLSPGETGTYCADYGGVDGGPITQAGFCANYDGFYQCMEDGCQTQEGGSGQYCWDWTASDELGDWDVCCQARNDGIDYGAEECRGDPSCIDSVRQVPCEGPNACMQVQVVDLPTYTIKYKAVCENGATPKQGGKIRLAWRLYPGCETPGCGWHDGERVSPPDGEHSIAFTIEEPENKVSLVLYAPLRGAIGLELYGTSPHPGITYTTKWNKPVAHWEWENVPSGEYAIDFKAPAAWCEETPSGNPTCEDHQTKIEYSGLGFIFSPNGSSQTTEVVNVPVTNGSFPESVERVDFSYRAIEGSDNLVSYDPASDPTPDPFGTTITPGGELGRGFTTATVYLEGGDTCIGEVNTAVESPSPYQFGCSSVLGYSLNPDRSLNEVITDYSTVSVGEEIALVAETSCQTTDGSGDPCEVERAKFRVNGADIGSDATKEGDTFTDYVTIPSTGHFVVEVLFFHPDYGWQ